MSDSFDDLVIRREPNYGMEDNVLLENDYILDYIELLDRQILTETNVNRQSFLLKNIQNELKKLSHLIIPPHSYSTEDINRINQLIYKYHVPVRSRSISSSRSSSHSSSSGLPTRFSPRLRGLPVVSLSPKRSISRKSKKKSNKKPKTRKEKRRDQKRRRRRIK